MSLRRHLLAFALLLACARGLLAIGPVTIVAFGDSITAGYGDDPANPNPGYPARLEALLGGSGFDATVLNRGVSGETTAEGLSRLDAVLAEGGDWIVLMEGTNDIFHGVSTETIRFNLNAMAHRALVAGLAPVHASVVPHRPDGVGDNSNVATRALRDSIFNLAELTARPVVDPFSAFWEIQGFSTTHYLADPLDPVGHPNARGYDLLAGVFADALVPILGDPGSGEITVLTDPIVAGELASFAVDLRGFYDSVIWSFGPEGRAWGRREEGYGADFIFAAPGTYTVAMRAVATNGEIVTDSVAVTVGGAAPSWQSKRTLIPLVARDARGGAGGTRTDLWLVNERSQAVEVTAELLPQTGSGRGQGSAPMRRTIGLRRYEAVLVPDLLGSFFGLADSRGALLLTWRTAGGASPSVLAETRLLSPRATAGPVTTLVPEIPESAWTTDLPLAGAWIDTSVSSGLWVVNPSGAALPVTIDLFAPDGTSLGSKAISVPARSETVRAVRSLFPALSPNLGPFSARFRSGAGGMAAGAEIAFASSGDRVVMPASPPSSLRRLTVPLASAGEFSLDSRLAIFNPANTATSVTFTFIPQRDSGLSAPSATLSIAPRSQLVLDDPLGDLFGWSSGRGGLRLIWSNPEGIGPAVQALMARAGAAPLAAWIPALTSEATGALTTGMGGASDGDLATSVLLVNLAVSPSEVELYLVDQHGEPLDVATVQLESSEQVVFQFGELFPAVPEPELYTLQAVEIDGPVLAALVTESATGDLFFRSLRVAP